jgi:hypothetical protein
MDRVKSPVAQCVCKYLRAYAFIGDDGGDPEVHLLPPVALVTNTCMDDLSDRFPLMSSSKCCIALHVQGLFHIARCKSGIVPAPHAEALEDYSELMTDSALRVVDLDLRHSARRPRRPRRRILRNPRQVRKLAAQRTRRHYALSSAQDTNMVERHQISEFTKDLPPAAGAMSRRSGSALVRTRPGG